MKRFRIPALVALALAAACMTTVAVAQNESGTEARAPFTQVQGDLRQVLPNTIHGQGVHCPPGTVPTGGGGKSPNDFLVMTESFADGDEWIVTYRNIGGQPANFRPFAVCSTP
ncbi:hypothetical protein [Streptomyces sp. NPDC048057]|uniref:hypothetical protein n=1 Tax=Streptomyces sp. NPDC048057 TaxID=3155628 RepID=UPI0033FBB8C7